MTASDFTESEADRSTEDEEREYEHTRKKLN